VLNAESALHKSRSIGTAAFAALTFEDRARENPTLKSSDVTSPAADDETFQCRPSPSRGTSRVDRTCLSRGSSRIRGITSFRSEFDLERGAAIVMSQIIDNST